MITSDSAGIPTAEDIASRLKYLNNQFRNTIHQLSLVGDDQLHVAAQRSGVNLRNFESRLKRITEIFDIAHLAPNVSRNLLRLAWSKYPGDVVPPGIKSAEQKAVSLQNDEVVSAAKILPGIAVPWPKGAQAVDIVSGVFNGKSPSLEIEQEVKSREAKGFKPAYVLITASQQDPTTSIGQVILFK